MSFGKKTHDILAGDQAVHSLVAGRIYPLVAPQKQGPNGTQVPADVWPALIYTVVTDLPTPMTAGVRPPRTARAQVDCYARRYQEAHSLADAVVGALGAKKTRFTSVLLSRRDGFEKDTGLYRVSLDFSQVMTEADDE